jgi:hypothetical protein
MFCQGSGVGSKLLFHALKQIAAASRYIGFEVVVVHAIDSDAVTFYAQRGFTQFEDHELHLFMPAVMERARAVLAEDRLLRLTPHEVNQLERALDSEPDVVPQLKAFIRRISESSGTVSS